MKFKKILCLNYDQNKLDKFHWDEFRNLSEELIIANENELGSHFTDTDCLLVKLGAKVDKDLIDKFPRLKYIGMLGTGIGGIDKEYAKSKNITVANITNYATQGVAEFTFGVLISHMRELERARKQALDGDYSEGTFTGSEIAGKTFGVIGMGNIGKRIAELAKIFGAEVVYWSKNSRNDNFHYAKLDDVLKISDIVSINLALTPETNKIIDEKLIRSIKNGAVVINTCPMELLDFEALVEALKNNSFTIILDHSDEMSADELTLVKNLSNCILYPPIGYTTKEATNKKQEIFISNIKKFLK